MRKERMGKRMDEKLTIWKPTANHAQKTQKGRLDFRTFLRQNPEVVFRFLILFCAVAVLLTWASTKKQTERELREEFKAELSAERFRVEQETMARMKDEYGITAESMAQKQRELDATEMAKGLETYVNAGNTDEALYLICFSMLNRKASSRYPSDMHGVVSQDQQYMGWSEENRVSDRAYRIALDACTIFETTGAPMSRNYVYVNWTPREVKLLDNLESGQATHTFYESDMRDYLSSR